MARSSLICCFLLLTGLVVAQDNRPPDPNNHFIYPPLPGPQLSNDPTVFKDNINFTVGIAQSAPFKWVTNMTSMRVTLNQEGNPESVNAVDISRKSDLELRTESHNSNSMKSLQRHRFCLLGWVTRRYRPGQRQRCISSSMELQSAGDACLLLALH